MELDRPLLKERSKQLIRESNPKVLTASVLFIALSALITVLSTRLAGIDADTAMRYMQYLQDGNTDAALRVLSSTTPSTGAQLVNLLLKSVSIIVALGFEIFLLNTLRGTAPMLANLLDGFGYWWKVLLIDLVCGVLILLWSLLLIVPGIIAAYRYSMAHYVLITNPDLGVMDCIRESKRLTQGWKGALFVMDLSYLGWAVLCAIPVLGWLLSIWVTPYRALTFLQAYEQISGCTTPVETAAENW